MTKDELIKVREDIEARWNDLQVEANRIQGEHRIVSGLIDRIVEPEVKSAAEAVGELTKKKEDDGRTSTQATK